jgi:hypothetical protein
MWMVKAGGVLAFLLLGIGCASAQPCQLTVNKYGLSSDSADWSMRIVAGRSCIGGFRVGDVTIENVRVVAPPTSGDVTLKGPGFTYKAKTNFQGQDSFAVMVSGSSRKVPGLSLVRVLISVQNPNAPAAPEAAPVPNAPAAPARRSALVRPHGPPSWFERCAPCL